MNLRAADDRTGEIPLTGGAFIDPLLQPLPPQARTDGRLGRSDRRSVAPSGHGGERPRAAAPVEIEPRLGFEDFYRAQRANVGRALAVTFGDYELAAEAVDEAMTRAYARWSKVATLGNPGGWVYRVGFNWGISVLRRRRRSSPSAGADRPVELPVTSEPAIAAALATLPPAHRAVVVCRLMLGWSERQTADALRIRPGTVKSRLHRASTRLQSELHHLKPEES